MAVVPAVFCARQIATVRRVYVRLTAKLGRPRAWECEGVTSTATALRHPTPSSGVVAQCQVLRLATQGQEHSAAWHRPKRIHDYFPLFRSSGKKNGGRSTGNDGRNAAAELDAMISGRLRRECDPLATETALDTHSA